MTWLLAWLVLDERRILASRSGLLPCLRHQASHHHQIQHSIELHLKLYLSSTQ